MLSTIQMWRYGIVRYRVYSRKFWTVGQLRKFLLPPPADNRNLYITLECYKIGKGWVWQDFLFTNTK